MGTRGCTGHALLRAPWAGSNGCSIVAGEGQQVDSGCGQRAPACAARHGVAQGTLLQAPSQADTLLTHFVHLLHPQHAKLLPKSTHVAPHLLLQQLAIQNIPRHSQALTRARHSQALSQAAPHLLQQLAVQHVPRPALHLIQLGLGGVAAAAMNVNVNVIH